MEWIKDFYTQSRNRWGASGILPHHRDRAASIQRLCGPGAKGILELGAGAGGTAAALAELGHDVIAIELAVPPVVEAAYSEMERQATNGHLKFVEGDFYKTNFDCKFDIVGYWNGFGVGTDSDQRRLLKRIASEWLAPNGCLLLDISNPWPWVEAAGIEKLVETDEAGVWIQRNDFDSINSRFIDSWWPEGKPELKSAQTIRSYTPADFLLLIENTGLVVDHFEIDGILFSLDSSDLASSSELAESWDFHAKLVLDS